MRGCQNGKITKGKREVPMQEKCLVCNWDQEGSKEILIHRLKNPLKKLEMQYHTCWEHDINRMPLT